MYAIATATSVSGIVLLSLLLVWHSRRVSEVERQLSEARLLVSQGKRRDALQLAVTACEALRHVPWSEESLNQDGVEAVQSSLPCFEIARYLMPARISDLEVAPTEQGAIYVSSGNEIVSLSEGKRPRLIYRSKGTLEALSLARSPASEGLICSVRSDGFSEIYRVSPRGDGRMLGREPTPVRFVKFHASGAHLVGTNERLMAVDKGREQLENIGRSMVSLISGTYSEDNVIALGKGWVQDWEWNQGAWSGARQESVLGPSGWRYDVLCATPEIRLALTERPSKNELRILKKLEDQWAEIELDQPARVTCGTISPDGRYIGVGLADGAVRQFEVESGQEREVGRHDGTVTHLEITSTNLLVTASADLTVRVWKPEQFPEPEGQIRPVTHELQHSCNYLHVNPDGSLFSPQSFVKEPAGRKGLWFCSQFGALNCYGANEEYAGRATFFSERERQAFIDLPSEVDGSLGPQGDTIDIFWQPRAAGICSPRLVVLALTLTRQSGATEGKLLFWDPTSDKIVERELPGPANLLAVSRGQSAHVCAIDQAGTAHFFEITDPDAPDFGVLSTGEVPVGVPAESILCTDLDQLGENLVVAGHNGLSLASRPEQKTLLLASEPFAHAGFSSDKIISTNTNNRILCWSRERSLQKGRGVLSVAYESPQDLRLVAEGTENTFFSLHDDGFRRWSCGDLTLDEALSKARQVLRDHH